MALSSLVTNRVVADPQYDFLVATNFYGGSNEAFYFDVVQNRLKISYAFPVQVNGTYQNSNIARLWRVRVPSMAVEEIALVPPAATGRHRRRRAHPHRDSGRQRPAASSAPSRRPTATISAVVHYYNSNIMRELFGSRDGGERTVSAIVKDGRAVPGSEIGGAPYGAYNTRFIGWVAKDQ